MEKRLASAAERYLNSRHQNKRRTQVLRVLAVLVVLVTVSALIMPAVTMSNEVECGLEEHTHTDSCYTVQMAAPQPELTCTAGASGETLIHTHDSYCYNAQGELICTQPELAAHVHGPECYQERRELTCQEIQDLGHTHTGSCYAYEKGGLACGLEEGGGHTHTPECYPVERSEVPLCGQEESEDVVDEATGQVLVPGHRHTSECWERRVDSMLVCGREESDDVVDEATGEVLVPGHHHGPECWLSGDELCYQRGCGQHEGQGHTHTEECYGWAQTESLCGEVERPAGHIHDDSCYNITQVLTCHIPELEPHTHDAGCYTEGGVLICGRPEAAVHQHTEACFIAPEGSPEETRILTCGKEEHIHTDLCYVRAEPEETETFYCGLEEHIHSLDKCYFPSGALKCTLGEHVHDASCMIPPVEESDGPLESDDPLATDDPLASQDPAESGEPEPSESMEPERQEFWVEESIPYQTDAFQVTFQVKGWVKPTLDSQGTAASANETWVNDFGPGAVNTPSYEEGLVELVNQNIPLGALPVGYSASLDPDALPGADPFAEYNQPAVEPGPAGPVGSVVDDNRPGVPDNLVPINPEAGNEPVVTPAPIVEPDLTPNPEASFEPTPTPEVSQKPETPVELSVEELAEDDPEFQLLLDALEEPEEQVTVVLQRAVRVGATRDGMELDLSQCAITATVRPTQALIQQVSQRGEDIMDIAEDGLESGASEETDGAEPVMTCSSLDGVETAMFLGQDEPEATMTLNNGIMLLSVSDQVYPEFYVEYYAYLETVNTDGENVGKDVSIATLMNTDNGGTGANGKLPSAGNKDTQALLNMQVTSAGDVVTDADAKKTKPIFTKYLFSYATAPRLNIIDIVSKKTEGDNHYTLAEIWRIGPEGQPVESYPPSAELTNNPRTVRENPGQYILIEKGDIIRLVYETTNKDSGKLVEDANFFDYDISDGNRYNSADLKDEDKTGKTGKFLYTNKQGINSSANYSGTGKKYAFGGDNTRTTLGKENFGGQNINKVNTTGQGGKNNYAGCAFGLVESSLGTNGKLQFKNGIDAPDLFGSATGSKPYKGEITFKRQGDTYTMTTTTVDGQTTSGLDKLYAGATSSSFGFTMYTNHFWPMDNVASAGTLGHDPKFGPSKNNYTTFDGKLQEGTPGSDDETNEHNVYFGMNFKVDFTLYDDYIGPLEYYFFGDDDMWVYLTDKVTSESRLICDIGGVHPSVGEYVNLWDWIKKDGRDHVDATKTQDPELLSKGGHEYELTFFYTERGASGSTCWMQFTLPEARGGSLRTPTSADYGTLEVGKSVNGPQPPKDKYFDFKLKLTDVNGGPLSDLAGGVYVTDGNAGGMDQADTAVGMGDDGYWHFTLRNSQRLLIKDLPAGTRYELTEVDNTGYSTSFVVNDVDALNGGSVGPVESPGTTVTGTITGGHAVSAICWNTASYELPETGGAGATYTMACVPLLAAACLWYKKKSKGEEAAL